MPAPLADPRPTWDVDDGTTYVTGWRCDACRYPSATLVPRCPVCRAVVSPARFGPDGSVFASTCLRVAVPGYDPPQSLAYLTIDDGPRVLVHVAGSEALAVGSRARLAGASGSRDLMAAPLKGEVA